MEQVIFYLLIVIMLFALVKFFTRVEGMEGSPLSLYMESTDYLRGSKLKGPCTTNQWKVPYSPSSCGSYKDLAWHAMEPRKVVIDNHLNCESCKDYNYVAPEGIRGYDTQPLMKEYVSEDLQNHFIDNPHRMSNPMGNGIGCQCQDCALKKGFADKGCGCTKRSLFVVD